MYREVAARPCLAGNEARADWIACRGHNDWNVVFLTACTSDVASATIIDAPFTSAIRLPLRKPSCTMRPQLEQRLSLVDFGHFRSRRKAIEGWRENGAGFSGAAGRLVELGE